MAAGACWASIRGTITLRDGRYGPYVNHGKVNALPKSMTTASKSQAARPRGLPAESSTRARKGPRQQKAATQPGGRHARSPKGKEP